MAKPDNIDRYAQKVIAHDLQESIDDDMTFYSTGNDPQMEAYDVNHEFGVPSRVHT